MILLNWKLCKDDVLKFFLIKFIHFFSVYGYSELSTSNMFQTRGDSWNAQKSSAPPVCTFTNIANANVS